MGGQQKKKKNQKTWTETFSILLFSSMNFKLNQKIILSYVIFVWEHLITFMKFNEFYVLNFLKVLKKFQFKAFDFFFPHKADFFFKLQLISIYQFIQKNKLNKKLRVKLVYLFIFWNQKLFFVEICKTQFQWYMIFFENKKSEKIMADFFLFFLGNQILARMIPRGVCLTFSRSFSLGESNNNNNKHTYNTLYFNKLLSLFCVSMKFITHNYFFDQKKVIQFWFWCFDVFYFFCFCVLLSFTLYL